MRPQDIIQHLVKAGEEWMNGAPQDDDITMMVIKMKDGERAYEDTTKGRHE